MCWSNTSNWHGSCLLWTDLASRPLLHRQTLMQDIHKTMATIGFQRRCAGHSSFTVEPTLSSLLVQSLVSLTLQGDQSEVNSLPVQQFVVFAPLHSPAVLKANNHVSVLYSGQAMSDGDGGTTRTDLGRQQHDTGASLARNTTPDKTLTQRFTSYLQDRSDLQGL